MQEAIRVSGLTKRYKRLTAVDHLNLQVHEGELLSLLGVNGAGKTTTVRMLCGLSRPSEGDAWIEGHSVLHEGAKVKPLIGISPQETAVAPNLTVRENLRLMAGVYGLRGEEGKEAVAKAVEEFGLREVLSRRAGRLSGGWQRRLSLAMALLGGPKVLFLDEPTLGLDVLARRELWHLILSLKGRVTTVLTTHYMEEAEALSDRIAILRSGRLLLTDSAAGVCERAGTADFSEAFARIVTGEVGL